MVDNMEPRDRRRVGLFLSGKPVLIEELNIAITPPTIGEIVMFGEDNFLFATQLITHTDEFVNEIKKGNSQLEIFSNFQLLMILIRKDNMINKIITNFLEFIFPEYIINIDENLIDFKIVQEEKEIIISRITPFNYDILKEMIDILFLNHTSGTEEIEYNPINDAAKEIAEKIMTGRKKKQQVQSEKTKDQSMFAQIVSSLSIGLKMDINIFFNYTPFQLYDIYKRFFLKQSYDLYQKISITPLMDNSKMEVPEEWTKFNY